jgi:hypothetical protein
VAKNVRKTLTLFRLREDKKVSTIIMINQISLWNVEITFPLLTLALAPQLSTDVRLVDKKNWDTQNFLRLYQDLNCQNEVKMKLTFTITVDSYLVRYNAKSNRITKTRN